MSNPTKQWGIIEGEEYKCDPIRYIFLLDVSGSMRNGKFEAATSAILKMVKEYNSDDEFMLIQFGHDVKVTMELITFEKIRLKSNMHECFKFKEWGTQTIIWDAIIESLKFAHSKLKTVINVITDGHDTKSKNTHQTVLSEIEKYTNVTLNIVEITDRAQPINVQYRDVAAQSGLGIYSQISTQEPNQNLVAAITESLSSQSKNSNPQSNIH